MLSIKVCEPGDLPGIKELVHKTIEISYEGVYCREAKEFFYDYHSEDKIKLDAEKGYTILVLLDGVPAGTGTLLGNDIRRVFVLPEHQGKGIGRLIMSTLEQRARELGLKKVSLSSSPNGKRLYDSLGYKVTLEGVDILSDGHELRYFEMEKDLV